MGLLLTQSALGFMAFLGALSLIGIVINNSIMLVDSMDNLKRKGVEGTESIVRASLSRMRPILTTAATTLIGLIPLSTEW